MSRKHHFLPPVLVVAAEDLVTAAVLLLVVVVVVVEVPFTLAVVLPSVDCPVAVVLADSALAVPGEGF